MITAGQPSSLEVLVNDFQQWRSQRPHHREPIPQHLALRALALLDNYKLSHVVKALNINHKMIKAWRIKHQPSAPSSTSAPAFIELGHSIASPEQARSEEEPTVLRVTYPNGCSVTLERDLSLEQLMHVLDHFGQRGALS